MAIKPIASVDYVSKNTVNFEGKAKKKSGGQGYQTSAMKAVPVAVLLAMSPMNQSSAAGEYNRMTVSPSTELVAPQEPKKVLSTWSGVEDGDVSFSVGGFSYDDNPKDAEYFMFRYRKDLKNGKVAVAGGQLLAVTDTPREDGRYLILYSPLDSTGYANGNYEIAYIPREFFAPVHHAIKSPANNNAGVIAPIKDYIDSFGAEAVNNAPNIEDCINFILDKKF